MHSGGIENRGFSDRADALKWRHCRAQEVNYMTSKLVTLLCAVCLLPVSHSLWAQANDPAVVPVQTLTNALLQAMKAGSSLSMAERYSQLEPVVEKVFALPLVTRLAVGPEWASFSADQQKALIAAFTRFTVANYAHSFHSFDGQKFEIDDNVQSRGVEKLVRTRIIPLRDTPTTLLYRMREVDGSWRVIDVYSDGVSSLALRRSDFASAIARGGAPELLAYLNKANDALMKSQ
jgi:phospholipid transport system substrate-binding protein